MRHGIALALGLTACGSGTSSEPEPEPEPEPVVCASHEVELADGSCAPVGVAPEGCGEGFAHDGTYRCNAILPAEPCPPGMMAVPGDEVCHQPSCGDGTWGDAPLGPDTQFVDASYAGGDSDGTETQPWTTLQQGVDNAPAGATVAVAAGSYAAVTVDRPVVLWGRCPSMVEVTGGGADFGALFVRDGADGTLVRGLSLSGDGTGPSNGVAISGVADLVLEELWVHDTVGRGVEINESIGPVSVTIRNSLVENVPGIGIIASGSTLQLIGSEVRDVRDGGAIGRGRGVALQGDAVTGAQAVGLVAGSHVHRCEAEAIRAVASVMEVDATLVRDTTATDVFGIGIYVEPFMMSAEPPALTVRRSVIERVATFGIYGGGATLTVESTMVRDIAPVGPAYGRGINIQISSLGHPAQAVIAQTVVERVSESAVFAGGAQATLSGVVVREAQATADGRFGDGVAVLPELEGVGALTPGTIALDTALIEGHARSGVASFGGTVSVTGLRGVCSTFDLATESYEGVEPVLQDGGNNRCGCPEPVDDCQAASAELAPPTAAPEL